jgi:hypothetical protein
MENASCKSNHHYQIWMVAGCVLFSVMQSGKPEIEYWINVVGLGAPSSKDPKFERRPPGAPWPTFHKSNDAKLFLISILKAQESLERFRSGLVS